MTEHVNFLLLGLGNGAVFAALGLALVVTFRSSGVVNFATSSIGLFCGYMYCSFREGELLFLVPGLPHSWKFGDELPFWPSAVLALVVTAGLGLLLYVIVFRPLRKAPSVARAVASLGLMVLLTGVMTQRQGTESPVVTPIFPQGVFSIGDVTVTKDRVYLTAAIAAIALAVWTGTRFTHFGLLTRAAASNEKGAFVSGISPDRVAALNWMIGAVVSGAAGILIAPIVPLIPFQYTLFIIPALAVAILGGFERLAPVVAGGLLIGMLQSELAFLQVRYPSLPGAGMREAVPLVLILAVLVVRAKPLPSRGVIIQQSLGRAPRPRAVWTPAVVGLAVGLVLLLSFTGVTRASLVTSMIFAIISLSYVVVTGYSGQISFAQVTLAGVAGFLLGPLTTDLRVPLIDSHLPFPLAPVVAALGATVIGLVIAVPAVRIRGLPVAVVTLALAATLEAGWFRNSDFVSSSGVRNEQPSFFGLDLSTGLGTADFPRIGFSVTALVVLLVVAIGVAFLRRSTAGTKMLAVRANERSAAAAGVNVVRTKITAFAIGAFIAGLGGALLAYEQGAAVYDSYTVFLGLGVFATVYMAGITSVSGGVVAGIISANGLVYTALDGWLDLGHWYSTIAGLGLVITVLQNPEGIVGPFHRLADRARARRRPTPYDGAAALATVPDPAAAPVASNQHRGSTLVVHGVGVRYRGVVAVDDVSFELPRGKIVGLIGPNGAGKTTLVDAITGFTPYSGSVELDGVPLDRLPTHERVRAGLGRTFQAIELYDDLSVSENVLVGLAASGRSAMTPGPSETLDLLGIADLRDYAAGELSHGTRQLVSIARALVAGPQLLLLDEPAAGLDSSESEWLGQRLRVIRDSGVSILLIDHDMQLVLDLCDEIQVLDFGKLIASGTPSQVRADPRVKSAYLGNVHAAHQDSLGGPPRPLNSVGGNK